MALAAKINQFPAKQWTFSRYLLRFRREHNRNRGGRSLRLRNRVHSCESACYLPLGRFIATSATLTLNYVLVWSHPRKRVAEIRSLRSLTILDRRHPPFTIIGSILSSFYPTYRQTMIPILEISFVGFEISCIL